MELNKDIIERVIDDIANKLVINIIFENFECIEVPYTSIVKLEYKQTNEGYISSIKLEIEDKGLKNIMVFDGVEPKKRLLSHNDITQMIIKKGNLQTTYLIEYNEKSSILGSPNKNQITYINDVGNIVIDINPSNAKEGNFNE